MTIEVRGVLWVGTRTSAFPEDVVFFRDVLRVPLVDPSEDFA